MSDFYKLNYKLNQVMRLKRDTSDAADSDESRDDDKKEKKAPTDSNESDADDDVNVVRGEDFAARF